MTVTTTPFAFVSEIRNDFQHIAQVPGLTGSHKECLPEKVTGHYAGFREPLTDERGPAIDPSGRYEQNAVIVPGRVQGHIVTLVAICWHRRCYGCRLFTL